MDRGIPTPAEAFWLKRDMFSEARLQKRVEHAELQRNIVNLTNGYNRSIHLAVFEDRASIAETLNHELGMLDFQKELVDIRYDEQVVTIKRMWGGIGLDEDMLESGDIGLGESEDPVYPPTSRHQVDGGRRFEWRRL